MDALVDLGIVPELELTVEQIEALTDDDFADLREKGVSDDELTRLRRARDDHGRKG